MVHTAAALPQRGQARAHQPRWLPGQQPGGCSSSPFYVFLEFCRLHLETMETEQVLGQGAWLRKAPPSGSAPENAVPGFLPPGTYGLLSLSPPSKSSMAPTAQSGQCWSLVTLLCHASLALKKENQDGLIHVGKLSPRCFLAGK